MLLQQDVTIALSFSKPDLFNGRHDWQATETSYFAAHNLMTLGFMSILLFASPLSLYSHQYFITLLSHLYFQQDHRPPAHQNEAVTGFSICMSCSNLFSRQIRLPKRYICHTESHHYNLHHQQTNRSTLKSYVVHTRRQLIPLGATERDLRRDMANHWASTIRACTFRRLCQRLGHTNIGRLRVSLVLTSWHSRFWTSPISRISIYMFVARLDRIVLPAVIAQINSCLGLLKDTQTSREMGWNGGAQEHHRVVPWVQLLMNLFWCQLSIWICVMVMLTRTILMMSLGDNPSQEWEAY